MVDFLTKPSRKMQKNNRAKGVTLKTPDIKIIMYVYTPLNKVFGFQGSNQIIGGWNCFSIPFLFEPSLKPFLKPSRLFELEAVHSKLQILPEKFWSWKNNKAQMVAKPSRNMQKNNRAKGVALETPDIKIIMYVYTPLNKVFGFQGSNQMFDGWILKFQERALASLTYRIGSLRLPAMF